MNLLPAFLKEGWLRSSRGGPLAANHPAACGGTPPQERRGDREGLMREANLVVDEGTITSHVKRIRRKFAAADPAFDQIDTVYGMGYRWKA